MHLLIAAQVKSAIRSLDLPSRSRPQPLAAAAAAAITTAQLQVLAPHPPRCSPPPATRCIPRTFILFQPPCLQEMETENAKLEAEVERMQAALAADRSMAAAAHKALASASDVARSWSENLGALQHSHQTNRAFGSTLHSLGNSDAARARAE